MTWVIFFFSILGLCSAQEEIERILLNREGKQFRNSTVAIEAYLVKDVMEVLVEARMYAEKPKINDVLLVGKGLGRLHYKTRETVFSTMQEDATYPITKQNGLITFGKRTKIKKPKGTLTRELFKLKLPVDKIKTGRRYQLWVEIESKTKSGQTPLRFKFNLENLAQSIIKQRT